MVYFTVTLSTVSKLDINFVIFTQYCTDIFESSLCFKKAGYFHFFSSLKKFKHDLLSSRRKGNIIACPEQGQIL